MSTEVTIALIAAGSSILVGLFSFFGVIVSNNKANSKMQSEMKAEMQTANAVTQEKIKELTREVREHNNFAKRMPVVENEIQRIDGQIKELQGLHKREA
jgi:uncharacterized membrane protein YcgQ (UPF0703/DUF1980 family)